MNCICFKISLFAFRTSETAPFSGTYDNPYNMIGYVNVVLLMYSHHSVGLTLVESSVIAMVINMPKVL